MEIVDSFVQAWKDIDETEKYLAQQRKRQEILHQYQQKYWQIALILWEVACANSSQLGIIQQKLPKQQSTQDYVKPKSLFRYEYRLKRTPGNDLLSDSRVFKHEVKKLLNDEFLLLGFSGFSIVVTEDNNYYFVSISGSNIIVGRPLSPRIGTLFVNSFYNANCNIFYPVYDVQFSTSTYNGINDNKPITLYSEGEFVASITRRDIMGNVFLSRKPVCSCGSSYLVLV